MKKNYQIKNRNFTLLLYSIFPVLLIVSVALLVGFTASAQSNSNKQSIDLDGIESGQLLIRTASGLSSALLLSTKIEINVAGTISRTKVSQRFINTADEWAEGIYVF
ncbi:MAG: Ca-activated chloride channel family protein, partial [Paracoccaceae bacterium]